MRVVSRRLEGSWLTFTGEILQSRNIGDMANAANHVLAECIEVRTVPRLLEFRKSIRRLKIVRGIVGSARTEVLTAADDIVKEVEKTSSHALPRV